MVEEGCESEQDTVHFIGLQLEGFFFEYHCVRFVYQFPFESEFQKGNHPSIENRLQDFINFCEVEFIADLFKQGIVEQTPNAAVTESILLLCKADLLGERCMQQIAGITEIDQILIVIKIFRLCDIDRQPVGTVAFLLFRKILLQVRQFFIRYRKR
ncbi:hypothetical protein SDC9_67245 [bioreactor metagenome]|uniref:Uncharacterized protein n=1 Tax=bioreactor metagenome TaxID=1076179 RepID=A0A644XXJ2_9ZZZZ